MSDLDDATAYVELFVLKDSGGVVHLLGEPWHTLCGVEVLGTWGVAYTGELDEAVTCAVCRGMAGGA